MNQEVLPEAASLAVVTVLATCQALAVLLCLKKQPSDMPVLPSNKPSLEKRLRYFSSVVRFLMKYKKELQASKASNVFALDWFGRTQNEIDKQQRVVQTWIAAFFAALAVTWCIRTLANDRVDVVYPSTGIAIMVITGFVYFPLLKRHYYKTHETVCVSGSLTESVKQTREVEQEQKRATPEKVVALSSVQTNTPAFSPKKLHFLDNIKVFLAGLVVSHHVTSAFGGCGASMYLVIGDYPNTFGRVGQCFSILNQAYFMSLFFFISAYFTPKSYDRKGGESFLLDKAKRIWLPAMVSSLTVVPLSLSLGQWTAGQPLIYAPVPGHCWFLYWLLIFNWVYSSIREAKTGVTVAHTTRPFPNTVTRWLSGALVCGFANLVHVTIAGGFFFSTPLTVASSVSYFFFFWAGIVASRNGWLSSSIQGRLDMSLWLLLGLLVVEAAAMLVLMFLRETSDTAGLLFNLVSGVYCVDMSLSVLVLSQRFANNWNRFSKMLADAAYTVYIIHPVVTTGATAVFVMVYNQLYDNQIEFHYDRLSKSTLAGPGDGSLHLLIGWALVLFVSHAVCWPLAWWLRQLPGLREVL